jgi:YqaJ-like viral recombinase domain/PHD-finger
MSLPVVTCADLCLEGERVRQRCSFPTASTGNDRRLGTSGVLDDLTKIACEYAPGSVFTQLVNKTRPAMPTKQFLSVLDIPAAARVVVESVAPTAVHTEMSVLVNQLIGQISMKPEDVDILERETVKQRDCDIWVNYRLGRLTASNFGRVCKWMNHSDQHHCAPSSIIRLICEKSSVRTAAMKHGISCERFAKQQYFSLLCKSHRKFVVYDCGLTVLADSPYLAASPDLRVMCDCHGPGLCEIKCPYSARAAVPSHDNLDYLHLVDGITQLSHSHYYFYQIQGQMGITNTKYCDLFVFTSAGHYLERVVFENDIWLKMLADLSLFWRTYVAPHLLSISDVEQSGSVEDSAAAVSALDHHYSKTVQAQQTQATAQPTQDAIAVLTTHMSVASNQSPAPTKRARRGRKRKTPENHHNTTTHTGVYLCGVCGQDAVDAPETYDAQSVQCDKCQLWYHYGCAKVTSDVTQAKAWFCSNCTE